MGRRAGLLVLLALAALVAGAGFWLYRVCRPIPAPRNVVLITIDTLRADRVGCYGSKRGLTPHLDALAADGTMFADAYAPVPLTGPSHATMLTGRYPVTHGLRNNGTQVLSRDETLISETLHERGFRTAGIISALVLASSFGLNQGFDLYYEQDIAGGSKGRNLWADHRPGDKTMDRALTWLKAEGDRPFFLWVHLFDPHSPYDPPAPYKERYAKTPYDGEVAFADAQVGRLLDQIKAMGLYDSTLIIAASDHGEGLGDHGEEFHAVFLYNTTTHVPLIVRLPGARRGRVVGDLASTIDIAPTILETLGLPRPEAPHAMQGVSLYPAVARGERVPARSVLLESIYPSASYGWSINRAIVRPAWKLIDLPTPELYDLAADQSESSNVYTTQPARAEELRSDYERVLAETESTARQAETAPIDDETRDRLMSLGYIGGQQSTATNRKGADPKRMAFMMTPLSIAMEFMKNRKFSDAEKIYAKALEADPDNRIALVQMGRAVAAQGRTDDAARFFEHAISTYPDVEEFYRTYGWVLMSARRFDRAQAVFKTGLASLPDSGHLHFLLGYARFLVKDWKGALEELDLAIRLSPGFGKPYYLASICRLQTGDEAGALASLDAYLSRDADVDSLFADPYFAGLRRRPVFQDLIRKHL